jgi:hypothetical protein
VAHRLVDHPGGDTVVLQPGREGVPEVGCAGVFERLQELLLDELGQTGALDWSRISVDSLTNDSARFHPYGRHPPHGHDLGFGARERNFRRGRGRPDARQLPGMPMRGIGRPVC